MEPENNTGTEKQIDRPAEKPSFEQQQLEAIYDGFKERLETFFLECKKQIQTSARDYREAASTIKEQGAAIEELKRRKSARELLDSLGYSFARLYRAVVAVPDEVCAKRELIACIQQFNREFENIGIHPIYNLSQGAYQDRKRYETLVCQAEDESQAGTVELDKMGFEIEGEQTISARCIEFVKDKNFIQHDDLPKQETKSAEKFPFRYNIDFQYIQVPNGSYIAILSHDMTNVFDDLYDWQGDHRIWLGYWLEISKKMRGNALISYDKLKRHNGFSLTIENGILYLCLCQIRTTFGRAEYKFQEKLPLAIIR